MSGNRPKAYVKPLHIRPRTSRQQAKGLPIINLGFNELPFAPPPLVLTAIRQVAASAQSYGHPSCQPLRDKIASTFALDAEQIICGNGSEELLDIIGRVFASRGDEILISQYGYIQFPIVCNRVGAALVMAAEHNYGTDVDALLAAVTPSTRIVFLANPNNPTGTMLSTDEVKRLADKLPATVVLVIDLAYVEFADNAVNGEHCAAMHKLVTTRDNVIVTQTFSKAFGIAGLRVGWCHAPPWMVAVLNAARAMGPVNAAAQAAATVALQDLQIINERVNTIVGERLRVARQLGDQGFTIVASQANFMLCAFSPEPSSTNNNLANELAEYLFDEAGIVVNQTREAGLEHFIRFSLSTIENNDLLIRTLAAFKQTC